MADNIGDDDVRNYMMTDEYKKAVADIKKSASTKKLSLSPNDVPNVKRPLSEVELKHLFSKPFLAR
jgi:hypothetical protein